MIGKAAMDDENSRRWEDRAASLEAVRKKLRTAWKYDHEVLEQYFQACYLNWKVYKGERTPKQVLKLQSIYKQAMYGDNPEGPPDDLSSMDGQKWHAWQKLRGMSQEMAKRRFITFLAEINPLLIDVMPDEKPPPGFPLDRRGNPICAKCNTVVGCTRPLLDQYKMNLQHQLIENDEFHEPEKLRGWIRNAMTNQKCIWGMHQAISRAEAKPFTDWFDRHENRGFYPYDSLPLMRIVRELVQQYHDVAYESWLHKDPEDPTAYNEIARKTIQIRDIFTEFSGETYVFEIPCERDNEGCNQRRLADGGRNHTHEFELEPPTESDTNSMEEAIALRTQCQKLGINPTTGVVKNIAERCEIYRNRLAEHFEALRKSAEARERNDQRATIHKQEKAQVFQLSKSMLEKQAHEACQLNLVDHVMTLIKRGCNPNAQSPRGLTPLLCLVLNEAVIEKMEYLFSRKVDINYASKYGMTALMLACRLKDIKMIHVLMRNGASALTKGMQGKSALHMCIHHNCEEIVKVIVEYLKESVGDSMRIVRFIDAVDDLGDTALITAAKLKNGLLAYLLVQLGANPNTRNRQGRTATQESRSRGWIELSTWLDKKVGVGASKVETYSDTQFEKQCRFGTIKIQELLRDFAKVYLILIQQRVSKHPLGPPFNANSMVKERGAAAQQEQQIFVDNHQRFVLGRSPERYGLNVKYLPDYDEEEVEKAKGKMRQILDEIVALVRQGYVYPNIEIGAQPLPITALMAAVLLNDSRAVKLLIREGCDVNHCNKDGTTALMLAAQLQQIDILLTLLAQPNVDLEAVDNQGYTALAYASSLPMPVVMSRDLVGVLLQDDLSGPRLLNSAQILKIALSQGVADLQQIYQQNLAETSLDHLTVHRKLLSLLQQYGLTPISNDYHLLHQLKTSEWRVSESTPEGKSRSRKRHAGHVEDDDDDESSVNIYEEEAKKAYAEEQALIKANKAEANKWKDISELRCPICTLEIPCSHFFKIQTLMNFIQKQKKAEDESKAAAGGVVVHNFGKKFRVKNREQEVLREAQIADRNTDRSATLAKKYQVQETTLEKNWKQLTSENANNMIENGEEEGAENDEQKEDPAEEIDSVVFLANQKDKDIKAPKSAGFGEAKEKDDSNIINVSSAAKSIEDDNSTIATSTTVNTAEIPPPIPVLPPNFVPKSILKKDGASKKSRHIRFDLPELPDIEEEKQQALDKLTEEEIEEIELARRLQQQQAEVNSGMDTLRDGEVTTDYMDAHRVKKDDKTRRIVMFTKERLGSQPDGFTNAHVIENPLSPNKEKTQKKKPIANDKPNTNYGTTIGKVELSGWVFVHLADIQANVLPLEHLSISQSSWISILDHIQTKYFTVWKANMEMELLIDVVSWNSTAPKCSLCNIGYVRTKDSLKMYRENPDQYIAQARQSMLHLAEEDNKLEYFLCLPCLMKKELFEKIKQSLPRSFRKSLHLRWPIIAMDKVPLPPNQQLSNDLILLEPARPSSPLHNSLIPIEAQLARPGSPVISLQQLSTYMPPSSPGSPTIFHSPISSQKLVQMDYYEGIPSSSSGQRQVISFEDDDISLPSISGLSMNESTVSSTSLASTISMVDPLKKPRELTLLPYLISKGHFDEAERTIRITLGKQAVDEGEGMYLLLKILALTADMYKMMGLWAFAVAIYADLADLTTKLLGLSDPVTFKALGFVMSCYRKMQYPKLAEEYMQSCIEKMGMQLRKTAKDQMIDRLKFLNKKNTKTFLQQNNVWVEKIQPQVTKLRNRRIRMQFFEVLGMGGLYSLLTAETAVMLVARRAFYTHCVQYETAVVANYANFIDYAFRIRVCDDDEIYRYFIQTLIQKYLAKSLVGTSELAKKFRQITPADKIEAVIDFLHNGVPLDIRVFDDIVYHALHVLVGAYRRFLCHSDGGKVLRDNALEVMAIATNLAATMIQCLFRKRYAKERVSKLLRKKRNPYDYHSDEEEDEN